MSDSALKNIGASTAAGAAIGGPYGALAGAAVGIIGSLLGQQSSGTSDTTTSVNSTNTANSSVTESNSSSTKSFTQAGADPGVIAMLKQLASTALSNSEDPSKTTGLLTGILQQAGDAIGSIFGKQSQAGIYNSSSTNIQNNDILSRAGADAAQAILGYQTTEQGVANTALSQLLQATATSTVQTDAQTSGSSQTTGTSTVKSQNTGTVANQQSSGMSIVCTWMFKRGLLDRQEYLISTMDFGKKPIHHIYGYIAAILPIMWLLKKYPNSYFAKIIVKLFQARTEYICSMYYLKGCEKKVSGFLARLLIASWCFPVAFIFYFLFLYGKLTHYSSTGVRQHA